MKRVICILVLMLSCTVFGQNFKKHTVESGETIQSIALKYKVTPYDIYKLNPDSQSGLKPNSVLLIPASAVTEVAVKEPKTEVKTETKVEQKTETKVEPKSKTETKPVASTDKKHTVITKETEYSISKLYNISIDELNNANPTIRTEGLKIGQTLTIPTKKVVEVKPETPKKAADTKIETPKIVKDKVTDKEIIHTVQPKETKYRIASKYGLTVEELEAQNPEIKENLPVGYELKIKKKATKKVK